MSYDIYLKDSVSGEVLTLDAPHHMRGGTYRCGGDDRVKLNVTYNYAPHFKSIGPDGIRSIYGKTGAQSIPMLRECADKLGNDIDSDYWKPTEGNAKRALLQLIALAEMRPDGVWDGD